MKWNRKTNEFEYAPYISDDGRFQIADININDIIPEYTELREHNWDNDETHKHYIEYCKINGIRINGANWALTDNGEVIGIFKTVRKAKEEAERR